jgi:Bacterial extracellular solute-binding proteins, family 5 Middle/CARDB
MAGNVQYNLSAIRELLLAAFTPETLYRFCLDRPLFQPVVAEFGAGQGLAGMADEVIGFCRTQLLFEDLLAEVSRFNPRQYARFEPSLRIAGPVPRRQAPSGQPQPVLTRNNLPYWIAGAAVLVSLVSLSIWLLPGLLYRGTPTAVPTAGGDATVTPTPTPTPRPKADLVVDSILFDSPPPIANQPARVRVQVRNQGMAAGGEFFLIWWAEREIASAPSCQWTVVGGLSPGGTAVMECDYTYSRYGPVNTRAAADTGNVVPEEDEGNNILDKVVGVAVVRHLFSSTASSPYDSPPVTMEGIDKDLAVGWEFSEDFLTLTMRLRQGVTLANGQPFTAADVKKKWEDIPGWQSPGYVNEIVVVDDYTLQFMMWQYDSAVMDGLAGFEFVTMN